MTRTVNLQSIMDQKCVLTRKVKLTKTVKQLYAASEARRGYAVTQASSTIWVEKIVQGPNLPIYKMLQEALWLKEEAEDAVQSEI